jgi:ribokinase
MYVVVTPDGERTILGHRGANVFTDPNQIDEEEILGAILLHLSGYALLAEPQRSAALMTLEMACRHGLTVTLDPGMSVPEKALDEMRALLPTVNIFLPNLAEARQLTGLTAPEDCAKSLWERGGEVVALKLGKEGCLVYSNAGSFRVPGFAVKARDTTGAGDSFAAGFICGFLGGLDWIGAAVLGNAMGALAAAQVGAATAFPKARDVLALLGRYYDEPTHRRCLEGIRQVVDYVTALATEPEEEGKPWWR